MKFKFLIIVIISILVLSGCSSTKNPTEIENNSVQLMVDSKYTLYPGPQPDSLYVEIINGGINVQITEESGEWIKVKYSNGEGWIPKWYVLSEESNQIIDIQSEEKVLNQDISGSLYPNGPKIVDLNKGKLLKPFREWNGWYEVKIIVYDIPAVQSAWVHQNLLSSVNEIQPIEGYLPKGTEVYEIFEFEKISSTNSNSTTYDMNVYIISERNDYISVGAGGGWSAWTKQQNLIYTLVK